MNLTEFQNIETLENECWLWYEQSTNIASLLETILKQEENKSSILNLYFFYYVLFA